MGGAPLFALNLVGWNRDELGLELLGEVLAGGDDIAEEAGFVIAGGHTVDDPEPKYGLAVTGEVDPDRMLTNHGLQPDQVLVLTKPLGIGIATTAIKADEAPAALSRSAVESMTRLNDVGARVALATGATGCTDVTGFGLLGHLGRMAAESAVDVVLEVDAVPVLDGIEDLIDAGFVPGGSRRNLSHVVDKVEADEHDESTLLLLADAQTSGGLVFGVEPDRGADAVAELVETGHDAAVVGETREGSGSIFLRP